MSTQLADPIVINRQGDALPLSRLQQVHDSFNEQFLQELLVTHPTLLPVHLLRPDVGELMCIGREVATRGSGRIDNLYLSTGGYPVVVETKLWRNPQARREVISQALDYVKEIVESDFDWFDEVWQTFQRERHETSESLLEAIGRASDAAEEEFDESTFVDRVHRALFRGDVIALIVGDGIETRLQKLVSHLCRDSAHLRYALGLIELRCYEMAGSKGELLVVPRLVADVEPIERAYVRIDLAPGVESGIRVESVAREDEPSTSSTQRPSLTEDVLFQNIERILGQSDSDRVKTFVDDLVSQLDLVKDCKSAAMMLKIPDPAGEGTSASLLGIERDGRVYNPKHMRGQILRWHRDQRVVEALVQGYWTALHHIDNRFADDGMSHKGTTMFIPLKELIEKLDHIGDAIRETVAAIREAVGQDE